MGFKKRCLKHSFIPAVNVRSFFSNFAAFLASLAIWARFVSKWREELSNRSFFEAKEALGKVKIKCLGKMEKRKAIF